MLDVRYPNRIQRDIANQTSQPQISHSWRSCTQPSRTTIFHGPICEDSLLLQSRGAGEPEMFVAPKQISARRRGRLTKKPGLICNFIWLRRCFRECVADTRGENPTSPSGPSLVQVPRTTAYVPTSTAIAQTLDSEDSEFSWACASP